MNYKVQEEIGKHFLDHAVQLLKEGKTFVLVLDNIDWDVKAHDMQSDKQNRRVHAVATSMVFDRISSRNTQMRMIHGSTFVEQQTLQPLFNKC